MAKNAVARETVFALRQKIAKIEGTLPERLGIACGHSLAAAGAIDATRLRTGCERLDALLGGGLARAALTEIHGAETRDAAAVAGFAMALCGLLLKSAQAQNAPVLWIGTAEMFREAGFPHAAGLHALFGVTPGMLLLCEVPKPADALWVAEEAGALTALAAVVLELRGNPARLDLTATRRLHRRAKAAGRPVFLLRQAAMALPTAAPARLAVSPAPAAPRQTLAGPLVGTIGRPAFSVRVDKCVAALPGLFTLEWNPDEHEFAQGPARKDTAKDAITLVSLPGNGKGAAPAPGQVVAFRPPAPQSTDHQPASGQRPAYRSA